MILTEQEIKSIDWMQGGLQFARAIESAVREKLKAQEPVFFADKDAVMSIKHAADTFDLAIGVRNKHERDDDVPLYLHPDPRVAKLEAVLRECREELDRLSTCEQGTQFRRVSEAIAKIDEVLK